MIFSRILFVTAILHTFSCSPPDLNDPATLNEAKKEAIPLSALTKEFKYGMAWLFVEENNETFSGWVKETHPNQSLKKLGYLKNGQRQGLWIEWYENGLKKSNIMWNLDRLSGEYLIWYQNKKPHVIGQTLDGEMDGNWKEYYNNGQLQAHSLNNMGKCISKKIWKINGELCPESHVESGRGQFVEYKENGEPLKIRIVKDGVEID